MNTVGHTHLKYKYDVVENGWLELLTTIWTDGQINMDRRMDEYGISKHDVANARECRMERQTFTT